MYVMGMWKQLVFGKRREAQVVWRVCELYLGVICAGLRQAVRVEGGSGRDE